MEYSVPFLFNVFEEKKFTFAAALVSELGGNLELPPNFSPDGPVVQWIVCRFPEPEIEVRSLSGLH